MRRRKIFEYIVRDLMKHPEAMILPWWGVVIHWLLFPLVTLNWCIQENHGCDVRSDIWRIHGLRVAGSYFCRIAQVGRKFEVVEVDDTGVITLRDLDRGLAIRNRMSNPIEYKIVFKNGHELSLTVSDGRRFVEGLVKCINMQEHSGDTYYVFDGIMICQNDIAACYPANKKGLLSNGA